jgi:hypothetical protein
VLLELMLFMRSSSKCEHPLTHLAELSEGFSMSDLSGRARKGAIGKGAVVENNSCTDDRKVVGGQARIDRTHETLDVFRLTMSPNSESNGESRRLYKSSSSRER